MKRHLEARSAAGYIDIKPGLSGRMIISALPAPPEINEGENAGESGRKAKARPRRAAQNAVPKQEAVIKIRSRPQVIRYSRILIAALEEVVDYDPHRQHNQPPPELRIDDDDYLREIRSLIAELRTLNSLLEARRRQPKQTSGVALNLTRHLNTLLNSFAKAFGSGAGAIAEIW